MGTFKPIYVFLFLPLLALAGSFFIVPLAMAAAPIYISQVQITGGPKYADNDFIELFNPNNQSINLKGYRLVKRMASATTDTLIKSWNSDATIPAHHFYLWANSKFTNIISKPDVTTTATLSANQGIALRLGSSDKGVLIDSVAWGAANNSFNKVASANPGPGQVLVREDLYSADSLFTVLTSLPRNSAQSDGQVEAVMTKAPPTSAQPNPSPTPSLLPSIVPSLAANPSPTLTNPSATPIVSPTLMQPQKLSSKQFSWQNNLKYLVLSLICLILFIILLKKVFWPKNKS